MKSLSRGREARAERSVMLPLPEPFLGRAEVKDDLAEDVTEYSGKTVLVTGAGGSIGSELCRQILTCRPARLVLFELSEFALYTVEMQLRPLAVQAGVALVPVLGSVMNAGLVARVMVRHGVQAVIHTAAYKHVSLVEANPLAGISNNVLGTHVLARAALAQQVERFTLISSDKAVRPANVMGATKRLAELVVQDLANRPSATVFSIVRFGNVFGSSGSVVPRFQNQIRAGGPVTVTDPRAHRYFMTVEEAAGLVLRAGAMARGGEVCVLDMGKPVSILDLARRMIAAAGHRLRTAETPKGTISIVFTGLHPGEKLREALSLSGVYIATEHPKIFRVEEPSLSELEVAGFLRSLQDVVTEGAPQRARAVLYSWVEGYGAPYSGTDDDKRQVH
ncbi:MAG: polysaccharide biosynthesis protein [Dinoroseobacter sp.]|nr:polysaccharide biosynthesis protein [Dinoroseobacter sp.]